MILVVDCNLKEIQFWGFKANHEKVILGSFKKNIEDIWDEKILKRYIRESIGKQKIRAISFRIFFGGDAFKKATIIDDKFFRKFKKLADFFPFYVPAISKIISYLKNIFQAIPMIAFFETAFFSDLPDQEKYYALPFEYHKNNMIQKRGFHGIFHKAHSESLEFEGKNISIVLDNQVTICAVQNMKPLYISLGYTPLEGVMSRRSCGDLDPGIIFYLMNVHNYSIYQIDQMLKHESGFLGLTGYDLELKDIFRLRGKDKKVDLAIDVFTSQIMKHIGAAISTLGGVDNIIFSGSMVSIFLPLLYDIIKKISFLGINPVRLPWSQDAEITKLSSDESKVNVYISRKNLAEVIFFETELFLINNSK